MVDFCVLNCIVYLLLLWDDLLMCVVIECYM